MLKGLSFTFCTAIILAVLAAPFYVFSGLGTTMFVMAFVGLAGVLATIAFYQADRAYGFWFEVSRIAASMPLWFASIGLTELALGNPESISAKLYTLAVAFALYAFFSLTATVSHRQYGLIHAANNAQSVEG